MDTSTLSVRTPARPDIIACADLPVKGPPPLVWEVLLVTCAQREWAHHVLVCPQSQLLPDLPHTLTVKPAAVAGLAPVIRASDAGVRTQTTLSRTFLTLQFFLLLLEAINRFEAPAALSRAQDAVARPPVSALRRNNVHSSTRLALLAVPTLGEGVTCPDRTTWAGPALLALPTFGEDATGPCRSIDIVLPGMTLFTAVSEAMIGRCTAIRSPAVVTPIIGEQALVAPPIGPWIPLRRVQELASQVGA